MWEDEFIKVHTEKKKKCWTVIFHVIEVSFACPHTKEHTLFQVVTMESGSETF
jgi:hypothetical protein